ncbi:hypothetical protein [Nocardiopsis halotolerans]|uniref:hypothetical protein n=1 Tax=Nocardiopsis halotolerans TaxID=124252 RepID=UPI00034D7604|nr:hypothetical protein [Nocardiopsis halotolerans]
MNPLLVEIGKKAAEHWWTHLALPGVLFLGALAACALLTPADLVDPARLSELAADAQPLLKTLTSTVAATVALLVAVFVLGLAPGLAVQALGGWCGRWWLAESALSRLVFWNPWWRGRRWDAARRRARRRREDANGDGEDPDRSYRISLTRPTRRTWMADRMASLSSRVRRFHGLDVYWTWPRLLLILPEGAREDLRLAQDSFAQARTLGGWGALYLLAAGACALHLVMTDWDAGPLSRLPESPWDPWALALLGAAGAVTGAVGHQRARTAIASLADLVESCYDLHARELAESVGAVRPDHVHDYGRAIPPELGAKVTHLLRKPVPS